MKDLSTVHSPIDPHGVGSPATPPTSASPVLTPDQLAHFEEYGYITGVRILTDEAVETLRRELDAIMDPGHPGHALFHEFHSNESSTPGTVLFHALGAWRIAQGFHDLLWNPVLVGAARQLLDGGVRFWHDQLFCKPKQHGGVVAWHQDYSYWTRTQPMAHLTCWIGLDDSRKDNGALHYVPGSHRWDLLPITGLAGDMESINSVLTDEQRAAFIPVPMELDAGEASFHHPLLVHGSFENRTDRHRRATVVNFFRDGVTSNTDEPLLDGIPAMPPGARLEGQFFPRLDR